MDDLANKYDGLLSELAKLLVPHLVDQLMVKVDEKILEKFGDLKELDDEHIRDILRAELQDCDFLDEDRAREIADEQIAEIDFEDKIDDRCNYQGYLDEDGVKEVLRNCNITAHIGF